MGSTGKAALRGREETGRLLPNKVGFKLVSTGTVGEHYVEVRMKVVDVGIETASGDGKLETRKTAGATHVSM